MICNQTFALKKWFKNLSRKSKLSSGKIIVAKHSEIEMKYTITFMKCANQPVMNAAQKMRLKMTTTTKNSIVEKDMEHKEITREKENMKIGSPQYARGFSKDNGSQY